MVLVWQRCLLFVLVLSLTAFAGCVGDDPAPEPTDDTDPVDPPASDVDEKVDKLPKPSDKVLSKVESKDAVFAPTWNEGQWWTYEVSGSDRPASTSTLSVVELAEDHYKLGSDSDVELTYNMLNNGPFVPRGEAGIQFDSLAFYQADSYQDYLGFRRPAGDTWEVAIHGLKFAVTKEAIQEVDDPKATAMGIVVGGAAPGGQTFEVVYSAKAEWFTTFRVADAEGADILLYELTDYGQDGGPEVRRWDRTDTFSLNAQSPAYPAYAWYEQSDGSGDLRVIVLNLRNGFDGGESHASVYDPMGMEAASGTVKLGAEWSYFFVDDAEGAWAARVHAIGGNSAAERAKTDVFMLQVKLL